MKGILFPCILLVLERIQPGRKHSEYFQNTCTFLPKKILTGVVDPFHKDFPFVWHPGKGETSHGENCRLALFQSEGREEVKRNARAVKDLPDSAQKRCQHQDRGRRGVQGGFIVMTGVFSKALCIKENLIYVSPFYRHVKRCAYSWA